MREPVPPSPHPGLFLATYLKGRTTGEIAKIAKRLGISSDHLMRIIRKQADITDALATSLETIFGTPPGFWRDLQTSYDKEQSRLKALTSK